jgi:hypothetical protein
MTCVMCSPKHKGDKVDRQEESEERRAKVAITASSIASGVVGSLWKERSLYSL